MGNVKGGCWEMRKEGVIKEWGFKYLEVLDLSFSLDIF